MRGGIPLYEVLRRPVITEKATNLQAQNKYVFEAAPQANKIQIKEAVEMAFKVKVKAVNVMTVPGKTKRFGRRQVKGPSWKKAIVTLREGHKIQLFEGV
ncbi:MAG: 50S ribosomal protein L23 [Dehalococcoidia bacterium]